MLKSSPICVDANLVVRLIADPNDDVARRHWGEWTAEERLLVAPQLLRYEVTNVLHRYVASRVMSRDRATVALNAALALPITLHTDDDLHLRALEFAAQFNLPAAYDAHYLALAEKLGAEFWTADRRLASAVHHHLEWVRVAV